MTTNWNIGRLISTLNYFEVIPFISCLKRLLGSSKTNSNQIMDRILVTGENTTLAQNITNKLLTSNYQVVTEIDNIKTIIYCPYHYNLTEINQLIDLGKRTLQPGEKLLFDFQQPSEDVKDIWGAVDDVVMGGVSESSFQLRNKGVFSGVVSTANNGGFASIRTRNFQPAWNLGDYQGILLRVQGDGKRYKFIMRCEGKWDGAAYCYSFDTIYNYTQTIEVPFSDLIPVFRAKTIAEAGAFDASQVYSMQLMLSKFEYDGALNPKFEPGFFALEIDSIKAYGGKENPQVIVVLTKENSESSQIQAKLAESKLNYAIISPESSLSVNVENLATQTLETLTN